MSFLPGQFPAVAIARGQPITTLTFVTSATAQDGDVLLPSGLSETDFIVYIEFTFNKGGSLSVAVPSGFTEWWSFDDTFGSVLVVSYRILTSSLSSTQLNAAMSPDTSIGQGYFIYRADQIIGSLEASTPSTELTDANPSAQTILAGAASPPLVGFASYSNLSTATAVSPRTMTPAKDGEIDVTGSGDTYFARKLYNASPANISVDMDDEGDGNALGSGFIRPLAA